MEPKTAATLENLRAEMKFPDGHAMLNAGSLSPTPMPVLRAAETLRFEQATNTHEFYFNRADALLDAARAGLAAFLGGDAARLVLLPNVTWAINVAFASLAKRLTGAGGRRPVVLTTDLEYGSLQYALGQFADRFEREVVRVVDAGTWDEIVERFRGRIEGGQGGPVAAIYVSHVTSGLAWEMPVRALCRLARERGIVSVVDGAHAPGAVPLDAELLESCDAYGGNCHKWMMAPAGAGFLHVSDAFGPSLQPLVMSWGAKNRSLRGPGELIRSIENHGSYDRVPQMVIPDAIAFGRQVDEAGAAAHVEELRAYLVDRMTELREAMGTPWLAHRPGPGESAAVPMAAFTFPACGRKQFRDAMLRRNISCVVTRYREDEEIDDKVPDPAYDYFLRASTAWFNTRADVDRLIGAVPGVMKELGVGLSPSPSPD
jgi:isopenicillin-N epimerase